MKWLNSFFEHSARGVAQRSSRRSAMAKLGKVLVGSAMVPLLPVDRTAYAAEPKKPGASKTDDPTSCDYWKYCAIDGWLCSCCGGTSSSCPPGTTASPITWIGTCRNPHDGSDYIVSYNDCCGKTTCQRCFCHRNEGDKPVYYPSKSNDVDWCMGKAGIVYNSTVSIVIGINES